MTVARFQEANAAYQARFSFPFGDLARETRKEALLAGFASRLGNDRATEIARPCTRSAVSPGTGWPMLSLTTRRSSR